MDIETAKKEPLFARSPFIESEGLFDVGKPAWGRLFIKLVKLKYSDSTEKKKHLFFFNIK